MAITLQQRLPKSHIDLLNGSGWNFIFTMLIFLASDQLITCFTVEELELLLIVYNLPIVLDIDGEYALLLKLGNWVLHAHYVINVLARTPPRKKSKFERAYDRRQAKYNAASERRIEGRALRTQRCATCGRTDHSRRSSKLCPHYQPRRAMLTPLKSTSVIKASLENSCRSVDLIDQTYCSFET